jgi:hypothetical protein
MARETYELSYLTKDTLDDHVKAIADAGSYDKSYLYAILAGTVTDPYAKFRRLFRAIAHVRPEQARLYIQDLRSLIPAEGKRRQVNTPINEALTRITKSYLELMTIASNGDAGEISNEAEKLSGNTNKLIQALNIHSFGIKEQVS